jgi:DNA polymerase delta subunit 1
MTLEFQTFAYSVNDSESNIFSVQMFGKTKYGESLCANVLGFKPSFCLLCPNTTIPDSFLTLAGTKLATWTTDPFEKTEDWSHEMTWTMIKKVPFWGFQFGRRADFVRLEFQSLRSHNKMLSFFRKSHGNTLSIETMNNFYRVHKNIERESERRWTDRRERLEAHLQSSVQALATNETILRWIIKLGNAGLPLNLALVKLYDVIDPILRFAHDRDLKLAGNVQLSNWKKEIPSTDCEIEVTVDYSDVIPIESDDPFSLCEMAFDIECYSHDDKFPDPMDVRNQVFQIGITLKNYIDTTCRRILLNCGAPCQPIFDTTVENFDSERLLLLRFQEIIKSSDPDLIYGYNSDAFDWNYLMTRADVLGITDQFSRLSRLKSHRCRVEHASFQSSAYGDNKYLRVNIPGRLNVDLLIWIQRNMPQERYPDHKLDTVAEKEIGENKRDVNHKEIFAAFKSGDSDRITIIGDYCCQDTVIVQKLVDKLDVVTQMFEMSNITDTPVSYLMHKGQQIKCYSQIAKEATLQDFMIPLADSRDTGSFKGAVVLEPKIGLYTTPVPVLDFASLYPSIQVAYNICYTTIVLDKTLMNRLLELRGNEEKTVTLNGVVFEFIEWKEDVFVQTLSSGEMVEHKTLEDAKKIRPEKYIFNSVNSRDTEWSIQAKTLTHAFAQNQPSVIPVLQTKLKKSRKMVKAMMSVSTSDLRHRVLNGRQLAIKVSMNSIYGFTSAFMLNLMDLGACVTAKGREMIFQTKEFMECQFEKIARNTLWTRTDTEVWYNQEGRETTASSEGVIRKFPSAVTGKAWSQGPLDVTVIGGDTDSVFCNFPNNTLSETISLCHKAEVILTNDIFNRHPIEMEYEKVYLPMVIQKKKNYIGVKHENDERSWKIDYKGIAIKRRNYCAFVKDVFWSVIYPVLGIEKTDVGMKKTRLDKAMAVDALKKSIDKLLNEEIPLDDLIISASLKSNYKGKPCECQKSPGDIGADCERCAGTGKIVNLPHVQLARRMKIRDIGSAPQSGQRFGYIVVDDPKRPDALSDNSEDPIFVKQNGLKPNTLYYLDQQIRKPLTNFLNLIGLNDETEKIFSEAQSALQGNRIKRRHALELEARRNFFSGRGVDQVTPLKQPKKRKQNDTRCQKITDFF